MDKTMRELQHFFETNEDLKIFAMNGSKVNQNIHPDKFQDYDVVFFTDNLDKYKKESTFLNQFGDPLIVTVPDEKGHINHGLTFPEKDGYIYLAQYKDGTRIDMQFLLLSKLADYLTSDSLTKIIGDKEQLIKNSLIASDQDYWQRQPDRAEIEYAIKEFWWQFNNSLKATLRNDFLYAQNNINLTREELIRLITWVVAQENGLNRSYGKASTQILPLLKVSEQEQLKKTFNTSSNENIYIALKKMGQLHCHFLKELNNLLSLNLSKEMLELHQVPSLFLRSKEEEKLAHYFIFQEK